MRLRILWLYGLLLSPVIAGARPLRIASIPEMPLRFYNSERKLVGIDIDILKRVFGPAGIKYKIILLHSSESLKEFYQKKLCDMVLTLSKNPEREKFLDYAGQAHLRIAWKFFARKSMAEKMKFESYSQLTGKRIGVTRHFAYTREFWDMIRSGKIRPVYENKNAEQIDNLIKNKTDLVMLNSLTANALIRSENLGGKIAAVSGDVKQSEYFNTFVKSSGYPRMQAIRKIYGESLKKMTEGKILQEIHTKYLHR